MEILRKALRCVAISTVILCAVLVPVGTAHVARAAAATLTAPASGDITALLSADGGNDDVTLTGGNYSVTIPADAPSGQAAAELPTTPTLTYNGVLSGTGTLTINPPSTGRGTLALTNLSTFTLPAGQLHETVNRAPDNSAEQVFAPYAYDGYPIGSGTSPTYVDILHGSNAPVLTVSPGAIVHFTDQGQSHRANLESYTTADGATQSAYNTDNIRDDGTIVFDTYQSNPYVNQFGDVSGTGDFINHHGGFRFTGASTYTGHSLLYSANIDGSHAYGSNADSTSIFNEFVLAYAATPRTIATPAAIAAGRPETSTGTTEVPQQIYEWHFGNSIHNQGYGDVQFTGSYHFSDSGNWLAPSLSDPRLDYLESSRGNETFRQLYLDGFTTFGNGTDHTFFLPANQYNSNIQVTGGRALGFDYNGLVRLNTPIGFASSPSSTNLFVLNTAGNHLLVTQPLYYHGRTQIDRLAILQLGDGTAGNSNTGFRYVNPRTGVVYTGTYSTSGGSGSLLTAMAPGGAAGDVVVDNGSLVVANTRHALSGVGAISLSDISGRGRVVQEGTAPLTLLGGLTYTGPTIVRSGRLVLAASASASGGLATSSAVRLGRHASVDLAAQTTTLVRNLASTGGAVVLPASTLTIDAERATRFDGTLDVAPDTASSSVVKTGPATWTFGGKNDDTLPLDVRDGTVQFGAGASTAAWRGPVTVGPGGALSGAGTLHGRLDVYGDLHPHAPGALTVHGPWTQHGSATFTGDLGHVTPGGLLRVHGHVQLGGHLALSRSGARLKPGSTITLVRAIGSGATVVGRFTGLAQGGVVTVHGQRLRIDYRAGGGHDVTLRVEA